MVKPERPTNEARRLDALRRARILDTSPEQSFDDLVRIAAAICRMPIALVSLVDHDRQWFKARLGFDFDHTARDDSFCAHALLQPEELTIVPDARLDPRFCDNPLVTGEQHIRFYAGAPLLDPDGMPLGSFCVMDRQPRMLEEEQARALEALSRQASRLIELHRIGGELELQLREREWYEEQLQQYQRSLELENASLVEMSRTDPLTGLPNRRAFAEELQAVADTGAAYCVAICDIDNFKQVNDVHGHSEGDRVLVAVAEALHKHHVARGRVARVGGEEFVVLFPGQRLEAAVRECEALRRSVAALRTGLPVTISFGVAEGHPGETVDELFARADAALYAAKRGGRNRVVAG